MGLPREVESGWWKTSLDRLGEGAIYVPWAKPEITRSEVDFLVDVLGPGNGRRLLDAGCGFGRHSLLLSKEGFVPVGVDVSHVLPRIANRQPKSGNDRAAFLTADVAWLPFLDENFDCVIVMAEGGIGYKETDSANEQMLAELARVLASGGKFVIGVINAGWATRHCPCTKFQLDRGAVAVYRFRFDRRESRLTTAIRSFRWRQRRFLYSSGWVRLYTRDELTGILARLGLDVSSAFADNSTDKPFRKDGFRMVLCGTKRA
ncbi:MAG: methyltransferase domain-containing protein [Candidatus Coatesbacteria bacterium]|nr:methyltransferase domain-containing protein [Candidatus Coatesbacteria bacterium]